MSTGTAEELPVIDDDYRLNQGMEWKGGGGRDPPIWNLPVSDGNYSAHGFLITFFACERSV